MKTIPAENFAVVKDIERNMIVHCGTWQECYDEANYMNHHYQSTAYVAQGWNH